MAHNLEIRDGEASFVSNGEAAWHGLGKIVKKAMTAEEAIKLARLNFTVEKQEIKTMKHIKIPGKYATVRTDTKTALGVVGERYEIIQNVDAFGFFDPIIDRGEAIYETAGVLGVGERIFITAKLPADITVKGDKINEYILLTSSHDGWTPLTAGFTAIRVVCNNTLTAALKGLTNKVTIRHTANAMAKLNEAARIMGLCSSYMDFLGTTFNKMAKVKITDKNLKNYVMSVLLPGAKEQITKEKFEAEYSTRATNLCDEIMEFALHHDTQITAATKRTVFGAYNAISGYFNYNKEYASPDEKMRDMMFNGVAGKVNRGFELCTQMI